MSSELLSPHELRVWHAFKFMGEDVMSLVGKDITDATGLSGPDFGVLSRLGFCHGGMRQQELARSLGWDKSRLSHQLTRMQTRKLVERKETGERAVLVSLTKEGTKKLAAARPVHAKAVRRHLLSRLTAEQIATLVRISNILGDEE